VNNVYIHVFVIAKMGTTIPAICVTVAKNKKTRIMSVLLPSIDGASIHTLQTAVVSHHKW